jgi:hypothetical protein
MTADLSELSMSEPTLRELIEDLGAKVDELLRLVRVMQAPDPYDGLRERPPQPLYCPVCQWREDDQRHVAICGDTFTERTQRHDL